MFGFLRSGNPATDIDLLGQAMAESERHRLRKEFTKAAISGLPLEKWEPEEVARRAVAIADAAILELEKPKGVVSN